jgi:4-hydroxybenzoate polyprenyltransferase
MSKRNFRIVTFSLLFAGLAVMVAAIVAKEQSTKTLLLSLTGMFYLAAAIQIIIYRKKPKAFDDKPGMKN